MPRRSVFPTISAMKLNVGSFNGDAIFVNGEHDPFRYDSSITVFDEIINYEATGVGVGGAYVRQKNRYAGLSITSTESPYQAKINEFILADSTTAEVVINTPIVAQQGDEFIVKRINAISVNDVVIDAIVSSSQIGEK